MYKFCNVVLVLSIFFSKLIAQTPSVSLGINKNNFSEVGGKSILTATLSAPTTKDVYINFNTSGSATFNSDYLANFSQKGPRTYAGSPQTANQLCYPTGIVIDKQGNTYVANANTHCIMKFAPGETNGTIFIGGSGQGFSPTQLSGPNGLFIDQNGNLYVTENWNHRVQKFAPGSKEGITVAGGNWQGSESNKLQNPQAVYVDKQDNVYIVDQGNQRIQKWAPGAKEGTTIAGGNGKGSANNQLSNPRSFLFKENGDILIVDSDNHRIQKWAIGASEGVTIAGGNGPGNGLNQLNYPTDIKLDANGNLLISDSGNNRIMRWNLVTNTGEMIAGNGFGGNSTNQFSNPMFFEIDPLGNLIIVDTWNGRVQKWDINAGTAATLYGGNGCLSNPNQLYSPYSVFVDASRNLYVADRNNHRVQKWVPGANAGISIAGNGNNGNSSFQLSSPTDVFVDANGNLYVMDSNNHRVQKWTTGATEGVTVAGGNGRGSEANQLANPEGMFIDQSGNIFITDSENHRVQKWAPGATVGVTVAGGNGNGASENQLSFPHGIAVDASGNMYISDSGNHRVQKWTIGQASGSTILGGNGTGGATNQLSDPRGIYLDKDGNLYITDNWNGRIQKLIPGSNYGITIAGGNGNGISSNQLTFPRGSVYADSYGNIFIGDTDNNRVQIIQVQPQIMIPAGQTIGTLELVGIDDTAEESDEIATISVANVLNATLSGSNTFNIIINSNDLPPTISFEVSNGGTLEEDKGAITLTGKLSNPSFKTILAYLSFDGTAIRGTDYTLSSESFEFAPGVTSQTISITPINNSKVEILKTIIVGISASANLNTIYPSYTINVVSEDKPNASLSMSNSTISEVGGKSSIIASLSAPTAKDVFIDFKLSGVAVQDLDFVTNFSQKGPKTIAGGVQMANEICEPQGVFVDPSGNVFAIDRRNHRIQKWAPGSTNGVTVAGGNGSGNGPNQLCWPSDVFVDSNGNMYVSDTYNNRIQKFAPGSLNGTTVAGGWGSGASNLNAPHSVFVDASGNIYVSDDGNSRVQKFIPGSAIGITVAGGNGKGDNANQLNSPRGIYVDSNGNVFVTDNNNHRVQKWVPGAQTGSTVAGGNGQGNAANQLNYPFDVFLDTNGNLFVTDSNNNRVQKWVPGSSFGITVAGNNNSGNSNTQLGNPQGLFIDNAGNLFIADNWNSRIQKWASGASEGVTVAGGNGCQSLATQIKDPAGIFVDKDQNVYVADRYNGRVQKFLPGSAIGITVAEGGWQKPYSQQLNNPSGVFVDSQNNVYITDSNNNRIQKYTPGSADVITVAGGNGNGSGNNQLSALEGNVAVDAQGNVYIADTYNDRVQKWAPGAISGITVAGGNGNGYGPNQLNNPMGVVVDESGNIYVSDTKNHRIQKWAPGATSGVTVAGGNGNGNNSNQIGNPRQIFVDKTGNIYIADQWGHRIQKWAPESVNGSTVAGGNGIGLAKNQLSWPVGVFVDNSNNIYISDQGNNRIQKVQNQPQILIPAGQTTASVDIIGLDDIEEENDEVATFTISDYINANLNNINPFDLTITSNDILTKLNFKVSNNGVLEEDKSGGITLTVSLTNKSVKNIKVALSFGGTAIKGVDYTTNVDSVNFKAGEVIAYVQIYPINDADVEILKTINIGVASSINLMTDYPSTTLKLISDDKPNTSLSLNKTSISEVDGKATLTATLSAATSKDVEINFITSGTAKYSMDYLANFASMGVRDIAGVGIYANRIAAPEGIYLDSTGTVYVADANNHRIQKWVPGAREGITIAGENGPGSGANQFQWPCGVYFDKSNNLFVADLVNHRIQKFAPGETNGVTVAGGNGNGGNANQLNYPQQIIIDSDGNIYIADQWNHRIQKWAPGAKTGVTVAGGNGQGNAANQLSWAQGFFLDEAGNIYVVDSNNHRIQKWAPGATTGVTVAGGNGQGNAANQLNYPSSIFVDSLGYMYITDQGNQRILKWTPGSKSGITVAGGNGAGPGRNQLNFPRGIQVDVTGNIYISDHDNFRVQKWAPNATEGITVAGGNGGQSDSNQFNYPSQVIVDSQGNLIVCDGDNNRIQKWAPGASEGITIAGGNGNGYNNNQLNHPVSIFLDAAGNLYVSEEYNNRVQKFAPNSTTGVTVAGFGGYGSGNNQFKNPNGIFVDANGNLFVADVFNNRIMKYAPNATTGVVVAGGNGQGNAANQLNGPIGVFVDELGNIYIGDTDNHRVQKWAPGASSGVTIAGGNWGSAPNQFNRPMGIFVDKNKNLFVADHMNQRIQKFIPGSSNGITVLGGNGQGKAINQLSYPQNVFIDTYDDIYLADQCNQRILKVQNQPQIIIPAGQTAGVLELVGIDDTIEEADETSILSPSLVLNANLVTSNPTNLTITSNDTPPSIKFVTANGGVLEENKGPITLLAKLTYSTYKSITANLSFGGTAIKGTDYTVSAETISIAAGDSVASITINPINDNVVELAKTILVGISNSTNVNTTYPSSSITLLSEDNPTVTLAVDKTAISELDGSPIISATLSAPTSKDVVVGLSTLGSATYDLDYTISFPNKGLSTLIGGAAPLNQILPHSVFVDASGNLFISNLDQKIVKWPQGSSEGLIVAGGYGRGISNNQFKLPKGLLVDANGNIFVSDSGNNRIVKWSPGATQGEIVAGGNGLGTNRNQLNNPNGIIIDANGNLYIADQGNHRIVKWNAGSTEGIVVAGGNGAGSNLNQLNFPNAIYLDSQGVLYVADSANNRIIKWVPNATQGEVVAGGNGLGSGSNQFKGPSGLVIDKLGNLLVVDAGNNRIQKFVPGSLDGITIAGIKGLGSEINQLNNPTNLFLDNQNNLYIVDQSNKRILKLASGSTTPVIVAGGNGFLSNNNQIFTPTNLFVNEKSDVFINEATNARVQRWPLGFNYGIPVAGGNGIGISAAQLRGSTAVWVDNTDTVYVYDNGNYRVQKWAPGALEGITVAGGNGYGNGANQISSGFFILLDKQRNLYISDNANHRVQKWAPGAISGITIAGGNGGGNASNQLKNPEGIFLDALGNLYVVDAGNYRVQKWTPGATSGTTVAGGNGQGSAANQLEYATGIYVDEKGTMFIADYNNHRIQKWPAGATEGITVMGGNGSGNASNQLSNPIAVTFDYFENMYVSDYTNNRIQKLSGLPQIVIPAGQTRGQIQLSGIKDQLNEPMETIQLKIKGVLNAVVSDTTSKKITIVDHKVLLTKKDNITIPALINSSIAWGDYDRDGDQDLAIMGSDLSAGYTTAIYKNVNGSFENTNQNLIPAVSGDIKWIDLDKDGYLDLLYSGSTADASYNVTNKTLFYKNNKRGGFLYSGTLNLPQLTNTKLAFGDLDNDGDIDLAMMGNDENNIPVFNIFEKNNTALSFTKIADFNATFSEDSNDWDLKIADFDLDGDNDIIYRGGYINNTFVQTNSLNFYSNFTGLRYEVTKLFNETGPLTVIGIGKENDINNFYSSTPITFLNGTPKISRGDVAAGDYNNDGLTDLLFTGYDLNNNPTSLLYYQRPDKKFEIEPNFTIDGLFDSTADWVDYDTDGDLDLIITGRSNDGPKTLLYYNDAGVKVNHAPSKPTNLRVTDKGNGFVEFAWDTPSDDYSVYLGYNIRLGTTPGGSELSNTQSNLETGYRLITAPAPIFGNTYTTQLSPGKYYWSVQAIDQGYQASPFANESQVLLQYEWKKVNQRNIMDRSISGVASPKILMVDFDNDKDLDMIVGSSSGRKLYTFDGIMYVPSNLTISNQVTTSQGVENMFAEDINNDNKMDLVINNAAGQLEIYFNNGNGFTYVYSRASLYKTRIKVLDMDNDGNQEVLIAGSLTNSDNATPKIYRIEWDGLDATQPFGNKFTFTDESISNGFTNSSYDFGDINNDGKIDFVISGYSPIGLVTFIYLNNTPAGYSGKLTLTKTTDNLASIYQGTTDLIDFDADGDLDIVFSGSGKAGDLFQVYENTLTEFGANFSAVDVGLNPINNSKIKYGDFNGDGFYDIFYTGIRSGVSGKVTQLVQYNSTSKKFENSTFDFGNLTNTEFAFADVESDGDLDLVLTGDEVSNLTNKTFNVYLNVRNQSAALNNLSNQVVSNPNKLGGNLQNRTIDPLPIAHLGASVSFNLNTKPSAPTTKGLAISTINSQKVLVFSWNKSTDDHTPASGLTYNLRIGTTDSNDDILASNADADGVLKIPVEGNAEHNLSINLKTLKDGVYYWSVQAIDASFSGSNFSPSNRFEILNGALKITTPPIVKDGEASIGSSITNGYVIAKLDATDPESDPLTYTFVSGNNAGNFTINSNGQLVLLSKPNIFEDAIQLVIAVSDGTYTKNLSFTIKLCESNYETTAEHLNITKTYKSKDVLKGSGKITGSSNITMEAPKSIELKPGFVAEKGTVFRANIGAGCQ